MAIVMCAECEGEISSKASECPHCGCPASAQQQYDEKNFSEYTKQVSDKGSLGIVGNTAKTLKWFALANEAVIISLAVITQGDVSLGGYAFFLAVGCLVPFISLYFSKPLAKKAHKLVIIQEGAFKSPSEESLYNLVAQLSKRAGLDQMPEVGIYAADDLNAFATGRSRDDSLVAFSSSLLAQMDEKGIAAVAAHEIAHIANGDMLTMSIVQGVVNALVLLVSIPLTAFKWLSFFSDDVDWITFLIISAIKFVVVTIFMFLGNLVVKAFSRKREFEADRLASELLDKDSMVHALKSLEQAPIVFPKAQAEYAAFKICSPEAMLDIFSTHPSLERRIQALEGVQAAL
ncbi:protease HtpX [Desulfuromonas versatilis]|uniref:Protease HtpX n=1 Tax=Desulfuromonas versatilis TaxID=2802975 RepID=A0ABN6DTV8_9BACT|nr:zinc metalloprotease HtpX [Desulfuromonas versatilis]BCR03555.1 protease HtpX [Desulfuromonas versatilis]